MKQPPPTRSRLLRSDFQGQLLSTLFLLPEQERSLTELARHFDAGLTTVHTEIERLTTAGLVLDRRAGRARMVRADREHPLAPALTELLRLTYGPSTLLPAILKDVDALEKAYLLGTWAARRVGRPGPFPRNLDVLLVGDVEATCVQRAASEAKEALRQSVRFTVVEPSSWGSPDCAITTTAQRSPLLELSLA
ncbi:winged helix-turn-helix domain-containing protein [Tessaracoccus palaemonis]|uniref:Winged helix-turn-helix domain-containing protein n=1 Tax=Tessaracoccus palaemonis TaxID=2829499 RepID=A0ABX8SFX7_9ACTN|nr:winged helix-turn-helix domain-containing protein [Tessaracoccus palaemonis]QXT62307.1 winged helix-turn-helix domain-containing protein [Tessaracoccus palaemonis]